VAGYSGSTIAVNARGDTAVAWTRSQATYRSSVHLTVRTVSGALRTRGIWSSRRASIGGIAVAIDSKGEVTIAWIVNTRRNQGGRSGPGKVYAAYGGISGRWKRARAVGRALTKPRLAVAPHGRVLLLWIDERSESRKVVAAWRARGHHFRRPQPLKEPTVVSTPGDSTGAVPAFDERGTAYVAGECDAVVLRARRNRLRFTTILDHGPALGFNLSLAGPGLGLASLVRGRCTSDISAGNTPGPVFAVVLRGGRFGPEIALPSNDKAGATHAVALASGGGIVSWSALLPAFSVTVDADGAVGAPQPSPLGIVPFTRDGGGDQVLAGQGSSGQLVQFGVLVRPVGGGPDQPAPVSYGSLAVSTPLGRAIALAWNTSPTGAGGNLALSVWRP
jgi:hypothetical protein